MSKNTPGPWLIADNSKTFVYALNEKGTNVFFAHVQDAHTNKVELEANARLIAELLEALRGWVWARENGASEELAEQFARAAIAKATGE